MLPGSMDVSSSAGAGSIAVAPSEVKLRASSARMLSPIAGTSTVLTVRGRWKACVVAWCRPPKQQLTTAPVAPRAAQGSTWRLAFAPRASFAATTSRMPPSASSGRGRRFRPPSTPLKSPSGRAPVVAGKPGSRAVGIVRPDAALEQLVRIPAAAIALGGESFEHRAQRLGGLPLRLRLGCRGYVLVMNPDPSCQSGEGSRVY